MVNHPSTAEFITIKLIQKFVSDEISLAAYKGGTAPLELRELVDAAVAAWNSTTPPGNVETVMRTILDPQDRTGVFWSELAYRSKVKTPVEFINSTLRILDATASGERLPARSDDMGMHLFTRDDPDGWSELGSDWIDTATMLERIDFVQTVAENKNSSYGWNTLAFLDSRELTTAEQIVDYFNNLLYQGTLSSDSRALLVEFVSTDTGGLPKPLDRSSASDFETRVEELLSLMLSLPQWHFQ
jgi:uncharacterized protein (DUF1800 family)